MKKILLILSLIPVLGMAQNSNLSVEEKQQIRAERTLKSAYQVAIQSQNHNYNKSLKQVLDSSVYEEFIDPGHTTLYKHHYYYSPAGLNTSQYTWIYDFTNDTLGKTINTFNQANQLISSISYSKLDENLEIGDWHFDTKKDFSYNLEGLLIQEIDSTFNVALDEFELYIDLTFTYAGNIDLIYITGDFGNPSYNNQRLTFVYVNGKIKREFLKFYDPINDIYNNQRIYDFEYVGNNSSKTKRQRFDTPNQIMVDDGSILKYYDLNFTKNDLILPTGLLWVDIFQIMPEDLIGSHTNKLDSLYEYGDTLSTNYWGKNIFYYNQKDIVGTKDLSSSKFEIFPNPTTGKINFKNLSQKVDFQVFDIYGKLVCEYKNLSSNSIDLSSLANGIYHLSIYDKENNTLNTEKILLNK
ncbi:MAG: T9SS type A sorting domain-containing protein [Bacteroidota bacterium]